MENYGSNSPYSYRPPNSDPYPPPPHHHGSISHSAPLHPPPPTYYAYYQHQPPPPYPYPPHQPTLQPPPPSFATYGSYHEPHLYPPPQPQHSHTSTTSAASSSPSLYPPLHEILSDLTVSVNQPTVPASPPAPSAPYLPASNSSSQGNFYGQPYNSFSTHSHLSYSGRLDSSTHSYTSTGSPHSPGMHIVPFGKASLKVLLLHGNLDIWVSRANNLPNMDLFHKTLGVVFGNMSNMIEGQLSKKITSDPYVSISVAGAVIGRTYVISNSENPVWQQHFYVPVAHHAAEVHFVVKDSDVVGSQLIGFVTIPVEQIYSGARIEGTYSIRDSNGKPSKPGATLSLSIQYTSMDRLSVYHSGVGAGPYYQGVPGTYFPLREGGSVTLYQDAHVPEGMLPKIRLGNGMYYEHGKCWHDMFNAICQARRLIYITGWSVWHNVRLVRGKEDSASECTLGELLRSKSQEGVRVLLLVWDDPSSQNILGYMTVSY